MEAGEGSGWGDLQAESSSRWGEVAEPPQRLDGRVERFGGSGSLDLLGEGGIACVERRGFQRDECIKSEDEVFTRGFQTPANALAGMHSHAGCGPQRSFPYVDVDDNGLKCGSSVDSNDDEEFAMYDLGGCGLPSDSSGSFESGMPRRPSVARQTSKRSPWRKTASRFKRVKLQLAGMSGFENTSKIVAVTTGLLTPVGCGATSLPSSAGMVGMLDPEVRSSDDFASDLVNRESKAPPKRRAWLTADEQQAAMKFPHSAASARLLKQLADYNPSGKEDSAPNGQAGVSMRDVAFSLAAPLCHASFSPTPPYLQTTFLFLCRCSAVAERA